MVDINPQAVSWPNPTQYIQAIVNSNGPGTTYTLKSGVHRMQTIYLDDGDTLEFEVGAVLRGSEDVSGWTWTKDGANNRWWASISSLGSILGGTSRTGYTLWQYHLILDGEPMAYRDTITAVDEWTAYYDSGADRVYIGIDPATLTTMELGRTSLAISGANSTSTNVTIRGDRSQPGIIENYTPGPQSENAGVRIGRSGQDPIANANWLFEDIHVRNFRGMALAHGSNCTVRRVDVYNTGQLGVGGSGSSDSVWEYCAVYRNGIGGWESGWEGGNTKWAHTINHVNRGSWYDSVKPTEQGTDVHPHLDMTGPLWYDIANDGADVYGCYILDRAHAGGRGFFWEISFSVQFYQNMLYELAWNCENSFWTQSVLFSTSGAIPGTTRYSECLVEDNVSYRSSGMVKMENTNRGSPGSGPFFGIPYACSYIRTQRNSWSIEPSLPYKASHGTDGQTNNGNPFGSGIVHEANQFLVESLSITHWRVDEDSQEGGSPVGAMTWSSWQSRGDYDNPDGVAKVFVEGDTDADNNPMRGGCL